MGNQNTPYQNFAYRVVSIQPDSPAQEANLQEYVDYILYNPEVNQNLLLSEFLLQRIGKEVDLQVYNFITQEVRNVKIRPKMIKDCKSYIGAQLKFEKFDDTYEKVYQVDEVQEKSPAQRAGLGYYISGGVDFIIGSKQQGRIESLDELEAMFYQNLNQALELLVYNTEDQNVRTVCITPNSDWGQKGIIGCQILHGVLSRIPKPSLRIEHFNNDLTYNAQDNMVQQQQLFQGNDFYKKLVDDGDDEQQNNNGQPEQQQVEYRNEQLVEAEDQVYQQLNEEEVKYQSQIDNAGPIPQIIQESKQFSNGSSSVNEITQIQKVANNFDYIKKDEISTQVSSSGIIRKNNQNNYGMHQQSLSSEDQTIMFHRTDGKKSEFLMFTV